jgi:predicted nucleic acid-binding protein
VNVLVVDASVWVAAADRSDRFWESSRRFLAETTGRNIAVVVPAIVEVEVACALARRLRDPDAGRRLGAEIIQSLASEVHEADAAALKGAVAVGTELFLRAGDALYAGLADRVGGQLISWDEELVDRANAVTPELWLRDRE